MLMSVVVPVFNEAKIISKIIEQVDAVSLLDADLEYDPQV